MHKFEKAIERYMIDLRRYALSLMRDQGDADELVQECLVRALSRPQFWDRIRDPRAYLFAILHNAYIDALASRKKHGGHIDIDDIGLMLPQAPSQPSSLELRDLERGLHALPAEQRRTVLLVGLDGLSYQEAADAMGVPCGTVMSRLSRARESLRRMMEGEQAA